MRAALGCAVFAFAVLVGVGAAVGMSSAVVAVGVGVGWGAGVALGAIGAGIGISIVIATAGFVAERRFDQRQRARGFNRLYSAPVYRLPPSGAARFDPTSVVDVYPTGERY